MVQSLGEQMWLTCFCLQLSSSSWSLGAKEATPSRGVIISVVIIRRGFYHCGHVNSPQGLAVIYFLSESGIISGWPFFAHYLMLRVAGSYISDVCNLLNTFIQVLWCASILRFQLKKQRANSILLLLLLHSIAHKCQLGENFHHLLCRISSFTDFCCLPRTT